MSWPVARRYGSSAETAAAKPATIGPAMTPDWNASDFNAMTRSRMSGGARSIGIARPAGAANARQKPNAPIIRKTGQTDVGSERTKR